MMFVVAIFILLFAPPTWSRAFECEDGRSSLYAWGFCSGKQSCHDGSDEKQVTFSTHPENLTSTYISCDNTLSGVSNVCALRRQVYCRGDIPCRDKTLCDVICPSHFRCPNSTCWKRSTVCDSDPCNDCPAFQHWNNGYGFKCVKNNRMCLLPQMFLWDGVKDCDNGSDLCFTPENGDARDFRQSSLATFNNQLCFQCEKDSMIIARSSVCNGVQDCPDMSDECSCDKKVPEMCKNFQLLSKRKSSKIRCDCFDIDGVCHNILDPTNNSCALTKNQVCDAYAPCDGNSPCEHLCPSHFWCSESVCWKRSSVCDGDPCNNCPSLPRAIGHGFKCVRNGKTCTLLQRFLFDAIQDCDDSADFCFTSVDEKLKEDPRDIRRFPSVTFNHSLCFQCINDPTIISRSSVCDDIIDCPDKSDECLCATSKVKNCGKFSIGNESVEADCSNSTTTDTILNGGWACYRSGGRNPNNKLLCDGKVDCPYGARYGSRIFQNDENPRLCKHRKHCFTTDGLLNIPQSQVCDGVIQCKDGSDETASEIPKKYLSRVCDGFVHCKDKSDEQPENCTKQDRFICPALNGAKVSISNTEMCDFTINCDDQSDEKNCTNDGRFYCENKQPLFVKKEKKFNGFEDCSDWSDECPSKSTRTDENIFSSRYELIANPFLRAVVWIMGFLAIFGNLVVMVTEAKTLMTTESQTAAFRTNHLLVLNLSVSDLLMGVYLLMLGAAGVHYSGKYCANDLVWRSSGSCTTMGILVLLSSETSVFTMVLLTSFRLYAVKYPFNASLHPKFKVVILSILLSWSISFTLAFIPLTSQFQHLFETKAWMKENPFFQSATVDFSSMENFMKQFVSFQHNFTHNDSQQHETAIGKLENAYSWTDFVDVLKDDNYAEMFDIAGYFGYYSTNSVCISKLYVKPTEKAWAYSLGIIILNFLAFLFVAVTYIWIYKKSTSSGRKVNEGVRNPRSEKQSQEMQKKIIRLIFTDFFCWIPISIMAFLNFGGTTVPPVIYAVSAIILLPINSSLNPLIYSNAPKMLYDYIRERLREFRPRQQPEVDRRVNVIVVDETPL